MKQIYVLACSLILGIVSAACGIKFIDDFWRYSALNFIPITMIAIAIHLPRK